MKNAARLVLVAILALRAFPSVGSAADSVSIVWSPSGVRVNVSGAANKDYAVEWCGDLTAGRWNALATGATSSAGAYLAADAGSVGQTARFYRARALPPITNTTVYSTGDLGATQTITLAGVDPLGGTLQAIIDRLPTAGKLEQFDGTPIVKTNILVTDPQNRVLYLQGSATDAYFDSFTYHLRRASNGVTSAPQIVTVGVGNHAPVLDNSRVHAVEDTPMIFQLAATDPDPGDTLSFKVLVPTQAGRLYQVAADNHTVGDVIPPGAQNIVVTNPGGYLCYVPYPDANGTGYENFLWSAYDSHGANGGLGSKFIDIDPVDDPPVATAVRYVFGQWDVPAYIDLQFVDVDSANPKVYFTSLPEKGVLYHGDPVAGNEVVVGQPYDGYQFVYDTAHHGDFGNGYAHLSYYVQDEQGLTSATVANSIDVQYEDTPPTPTPAPSYQVTQNSSIVIILTATDPDDPTGKNLDYSITALPQHGKLYFLYQGVYRDLTGLPLPVDLGVGVVRVKYVPNANYTGSDRFSYQVYDAPHYAEAPGVVNLNVVP